MNNDLPKKASEFFAAREEFTDSALKGTMQRFLTVMVPRTSLGVLFGISYVLFRLFVGLFSLGFHIGIGL